MSFLTVFAMLLLGSFNAEAQKKAAKAVRKKTTKTETEHNSMMMQDMIQSTAKLLVIDSTVVDKSDFITHIPMNKDCGTITDYNSFFKTSDKKYEASLVYVNGFGDKCFYNMPAADGNSLLYTADKLGSKWQKARLISEFGNEFEDIRYPYLMADGVTLYFSAKSKTKSLGGRDIFVTRLNTDSMTFYKPENIGLPYNSTADDYCCIIDELNNLGWLATSRRQPEGKVCIYTFVPSTKRWVDDDVNMPEKKLYNLALITKIADTWTDKKGLEDARQREKKLMKSPSLNGNVSNAAFVINDKTVYHKASDFKSPSNRGQYTELVQLKSKQEQDISQLGDLRLKYSKSNGATRNSIGKTILKLEKDCEKRELQIKIMEKKIRNAENLM